ncbi:4'-phosphopantetheinyl transferase [Luteibacter sp. Sphag1AF]|uniref:4'-phosphopantetheinyl transferase family protein n=1 Tax=Luteibacter sp. Sphag1AF TaxID=2587031 RepID=UPI00161355E6|nr:4'-phosphopantetheinyl transferase superfamily protein [Luteibacter sp. Sphag1AF]MBB3226617.1 4'-phosphopantetheinyl transferase [Luteibacter sp. Sphag1AF]
MDASSLSLAAASLGTDVHIWQVPWNGVSAEALFRPWLAAYASVDASSLSVVRGPHGKPWLEAPFDDLSFSWSHSGDQALLAVGRGEPGFQLGVDIERVRARPRVLALAERFFSADEFVLLSARDEPERLDGFLALWTAKEAVLKANGGGLSYGLHRASFRMEGGVAAPEQFDGEIAPADAWCVRSLEVGRGFVASVAWRGVARTVRFMNGEPAVFTTAP